MADSQAIQVENAELVVNNIQNKVGNSLVGTRGLISRTTEIASEGATTVLESIKTLQTTAVEKLTEIWEVLASTLKFDENQARRLREERNDPKRKGKFLGASPSVGETAGKLGDNEGGGIMGWIANNPFLSALFITGVSSWAVIGKTMLFKLGGSLLRGGFYAIIAKMIGDGLVKAIGAEEGSVSEQALSKYIPMSIFGFMMTRTLPGALVAVAATGMASVIEYIQGHKSFKEVSGFDWGAASLTGVAGTLGLGSILTTIGGGKLLGATALGKGMVTLGGMLAAGPVVIAVGLGVALGIGIKWLSGKIGEYKEVVIDDLEKFGKMTQDEFEKRLAEQKSHWFTRMFPSLAGTMGMDLTDMQKANITSNDIRKQLEKGEDVDPRHAAIIQGISDKLLTMSDQGLKEVLKDKHRASEHIDFMRDLEYMIQEQVFGPQKSAELWKMLESHKNQIQKTAMAIKTDNDKLGIETPKHIERVMRGQGSMKEGAFYEMEALKKMGFLKRYEDIKRREHMVDARDEFGKSIGLTQAQIDRSEVSYRKPANVSKEDWETLKAFNKPVLEMKKLKDKLERDVQYRLGKDFDYEKRIELLGLDNFLSLYYKALDVEIKKIGKNFELIDKMKQHPNAGVTFNNNNASSIKKSSSHNYTHPIYGTSSANATQPKGLLPPSLRVGYAG